jgi:two-component system, OmpR family, sensor kinase
MDVSAQEEYGNERQDTLLTMLERLLERSASSTYFMFEQAVQQVQQVLNVDLVACFFHDSATDTLVASHSSDTVMGKRLYSRGMDRLPLVNGGSTVEVFLSGVPFITGHADQVAHEPVGIITGLGVKSQIAAVVRVQTQHRGVLVAASSRPDFFSVDDLSFLEAIARWIGQAIGRNELAEQRQGVRQDQKRDELLTIMVHELRNYLQPLRGRLDLLHERAVREMREKDKRDAESGLHMLELMTRGIADAVDIARLNQGMFTITPVSMSLRDVVQEVVSSFASGDVLLSMRVPDEIIVMADPQRVRQALETMVRYALMLNVAEITVEVSTEGRSNDAWVVISVTGVKLEPSSLSERSSVAGSHGTQLDVQLYLTEQIALAHHGTFSVATMADEECMLKFAFPVEEEDLSVR